MEPRDRRPARPAPGERGSWSHPPVSRVSPRGSVPSAPPAPPAPPAPLANPAPGFYRPVGPGPATAPRTYGPPSRSGFGLPSLRRNVCPHFFMTGSRGAIPIQAPHLLKGLLRQPTTVSRCQLRGGVHLDEGYVNDVCLTPRFNQCVFYEDDLTKE
jgi:hypothetical protein